MTKHLLQNNKKTKSGFTILVAVITAGILLIIAMSIGGIALKEQVLSTASKESQIAFYAADTGMECALYWDQKRGAFTHDIKGAAVLATFSCNHSDTDPNDAPVLVDTPTADYTYEYTFKVPDLPAGDNGVKPCAVVTVSKDVLGDSFRTLTTIQSYGYSTCDPSLNRLQRGITTTY